MDQPAPSSGAGVRAGAHRPRRAPRRSFWSTRNNHRTYDQPATQRSLVQPLDGLHLNQQTQVDRFQVSANDGSIASDASNSARQPGRRSPLRGNKGRQHNRGSLSRPTRGTSMYSNADESTLDLGIENVPQEYHDYRRGRGGRVRIRPEGRRNLQSTGQSTTSMTRQSEVAVENQLANVQSEIVESQLRGNDFECMICCDNIGRANPIWYCPNCYNIFHLKCSIEWCSKSIRSRNEALADSTYPSLTVSTNLDTSAFAIEGSSASQSRTRNNVEWPCPACREVLHTRPTRYLCFCGKVTKPEVNMHLTPHSCGKLCGRKRPNANCPHTCNSICHPGKCLPCILTSRRSCFCGKTTEEIRCSSATKSCNQICGRTLACGSHNCSRICHSGPCDDCNETLILTCFCGQDIKEQRCLEVPQSNGKPKLNFSCGRICDKTLDCGKHFCEKKCHPGPDCPSCKFLSQNIKNCPCGMTSIGKSLLDERKSCLDPLPTCENKCNRLLICGPEKSHHRCQKRCHTGTCPPCKLKSTVQCDCKLTSRHIECNLMFEKLAEGDRVQFKQVQFHFNCEARCNKLKNCGKHRCYNKCCQYLRDSSKHLCDQVCGKKLACTKHNCPEVCHVGQCGDCANIGWEELKCHCGASVLYPPIPCGARPPSCNRPCRRPHSCGHPVKHECHDDSERCAPCTVFVKKPCFCGSDSKESVYCYLPGYSCGRTCKKQLACGRHHCTRVCHDSNCETSDKSTICTRPCPVARFTCKHPCSLPCHGLSQCPVSDCKEQIKIYCECGNKTDRIECYKITRDVDNRNRMAMMSTTRSSQDSTIMIDLTKQTPKLSQSETQTKQLDCDETCSILKRNKALAEALDIAEPDLKPTSIFGEDPLKLLREATAQDYKFVSATYNSLARFVKAARESDRRFSFMQFPPANHLRREIIHELAHHFNCTSESRDEEPIRHVVVKAYKNRSCVPDFNIEQLLPVED